jgi:electron transfer flavoprotein beta subunit
MKILVCISCVPETTSKINFVENDTQFDKNGVKFIINPNDEFGLTRAMWIKENDNSSIDVINVGLEDSDPILRKTLAIGADKAIRINSNPKDSFQVAKLIADHISKNNYDLIIAGRESIDFNGNMVPGIISELIGINFITNCVGLEINGKKIKAKREIEGGTETLSCNLPVIIGGQKGLVEESDLKIPNMRGIMQARQKPLEIIEVDENNLKTETVKFYKPQEKGEIKMISSENLDELINLLHKEAKVI